LAFSQHPRNNLLCDSSLGNINLGRVYPFRPLQQCSVLSSHQTFIFAPSASGAQEEAMPVLTRRQQQAAAGALTTTQAAAGQAGAEAGAASQTHSGAASSTAASAGAAATDEFLDDILIPGM
jgi:hypothetical protein